jgi:hypothetical protein
MAIYSIIVTILMSTLLFNSFGAQRDSELQKKTVIIFAPTRASGDNKTVKETDEKEFDRILLENILAIISSFGYTLLDPNNKELVSANVIAILTKIGTIATHLFKAPLAPEIERRLLSAEFMKIVSLNLIGEAHTMRNAQNKKKACNIRSV